MAVNPVPALTYASLWAFWIALVTVGTYTLGTVPACNDALDVLTGCDSTFSAILSIGVLGTIPNAPSAVNTFLAILGLATRGTAIWGIVELFRGT